MAKSDTNDWLTLNVGGQRFLTCRSLFSGHSGVFYQVGISGQHFCWRSLGACWPGCLPARSTTWCPALRTVQGLSALTGAPSTLNQYSTISGLETSSLTLTSTLKVSWKKPITLVLTPSFPSWRAWHTPTQFQGIATIHFHSNWGFSFCNFIK